MARLEARLAAFNRQLEALFLWLSAVETPRWRRLLVRRRRLGRRIGLRLNRSARAAEDFTQQLVVFVSAYLGTLASATARAAARLPGAAARALLRLPAALTTMWILTTGTVATLVRDAVRRRRSPAGPKP